MRHGLLIALGVWSLACIHARGDSIRALPQRSRSDVRAALPPLSSRAQPKGGLDLTTRARALAGGESGAAIVTAQPDDSLLIEFVSGPKPEMPQNAPPLSDAQIESIRQWIAAGALARGARSHRETIRRQ